MTERRPVVPHDSRALSSVDASEAQFLFQLSMKGGVPSTVQAAIKSAQAKMGAGIT